MDPVFFVDGPVKNRLMQMLFLYVRAVLQIGQRPGDLQDLMIRPGAQIQTAEQLLHPLFLFSAKRAEFRHPC